MRRQNWGARKALEVFQSRLKLVTLQLARSPYLAGDTFTAADISVTDALEFAQRTGVVALAEAERAYVARTSGREGYKRAMETCQATRARPPRRQVDDRFRRSTKYEVKADGFRLRSEQPSEPQWNCGQEQTVRHRPTVLFTRSQLGMFSNCGTSSGLAHRGGVW